MIEPLAPQLSGYFHFFGVRGALLMQLGRAEEARVAFDRAIALANTAAEAAHIRMHLDRLMKDSAIQASRQMVLDVTIQEKFRSPLSGRRSFVRPWGRQSIRDFKPGSPIWPIKPKASFRILSSGTLPPHSSFTRTDLALRN